MKRARVRTVSSNPPSSKSGAQVGCGIPDGWSHACNGAGPRPFLIHGGGSTNTREGGGYPRISMPIRTHMHTDVQPHVDGPPWNCRRSPEVPEDPNPRFCASCRCIGESRCCAGQPPHARTRRRLSSYRSCRPPDPPLPSLRRSLYKVGGKFAPPPAPRRPGVSVVRRPAGPAAYMPAFWATPAHFSFGSGRDPPFTLHTSYTFPPSTVPYPGSHFAVERGLGFLPPAHAMRRGGGSLARHAPRPAGALCARVGGQ